MKPVSEVIAVTVTGPATDPCAGDRGRHSDRVRPDAGRLLRPRGPRERPRDPRRPPLVSGRRRPPGSPGPARPRPTRPHDSFSRPARSSPPGLAGPSTRRPAVPFLVLPVALWLTDPWHDALALVLAVVLYRPAADLIRFALAPPAARRHYLGMVRARHRWHWLCRCTGLAPARTRREEPARGRVARPGPRPARR